MVHRGMMSIMPLWKHKIENLRDTELKITDNIFLEAYIIWHHWT